MTQSFKKEMRELMLNAWRICRTTGESFSDCLKRAWQCHKLYAAMLTRVVCFSYIKKSTNTLRVAHGTLDPHRYDYASVGGRDSKPADCIRYWDCEVQNWRMFKMFNLVSVSL